MAARPSGSLAWPVMRRRRRPRRQPRSSRRPRSEALASIEVLAGDLARAEHRLVLGLKRLEDMREKAVVPSSASLLAEVLHQQGRHEEAARLVDRSEKTAAPDDLAAQITWETVRAEILAAAGRLEDAEAHAHAGRAVSLAAGTDWSNDHAAACLALGEVVWRRGPLQGAETANREALALYQRKENVVAARKAHALLAELVLA
jgi:ATP/maltotriose-dependent transcriptional regulator MalT